MTILSHTHDTLSGRTAARILVTLAVVPVALVIAGVKAQAAYLHATLLATRPAEGAILTNAPRYVSLTFDEAVALNPGSIRVYGPDGQQVQNDPAGQAYGGAMVEVGLKSGLARGTYTVAWSIVSADSHAVSGTFIFSLGSASRPPTRGAAPVTGGSRVVGDIFVVVRWLGFVSFAVFAGGTAFILFCWPAGTRNRSANRLLAASAITLTADSLAALVVQGLNDGRSQPSAMLSPRVLQATLATRFGYALELRLVLISAAAILMAWAWPTLSRTSAPGEAQVRPAWILAWMICAGGLAATWPSADHAAVGTQVPLSVLADTAHLTAIAVWAGGLAMLAGVLLRRRNLPGTMADHVTVGLETASAAVLRFSALALSCVIVLVASGLYEAWRNVGGIGALTHTSYGHLLLLKGAGTAVLVVFGHLARTRVKHGLLATASAPSRAAQLAPIGSGLARVPLSQASADLPATDPPPSAARTLRLLRLSVAAEVVVIMVVLAVTAVLIETPTGREAASRSVRATSRGATSGGATSGGSDMSRHYTYRTKADR